MSFPPIENTPEPRRTQEIRARYREGTYANSWYHTSEYQAVIGHLLQEIDLQATAIRELGKRLAARPTAIIAYEPTATEQDIAELRERFAFAQNNGEPLKLLPPNVVEIYRRTPEDRRRYLTEHRDEAIQRGIPAELVDMMIAEVDE